MSTPDHNHNDATNNGYLFSQRGTFVTFGLLTVLMVFDFADRMILAALLPAIKAEWHITDATAGLLSSILTLGMVVFAFPAAIAIDRWSRVKSASVMGVVWSLASAAGALAQSVGQLLFTRGLVGIGEAGYAPAAYTWISAAFPKRRRQLALGLFSSAQPIGMAIGVAAGGYIATHYGWKHALGIIALPGLLVALALYKGKDYKNLHKPQTSTPEQPSTRDGVKVILKTPSLLLAYLSAGLGTLQWVPVVFFLPTWLNREHGVGVQSASLMTSGLMLLAIVSVPLGGWLMDRWNHRDDRAKVIWPILAGATNTALLALAFTAVNDLTLRYTLIIIGFFIGASGGTGALAMTQELVHPGIRAFSSTCSVVAIHLIGSVPGPFLAGWLSDRYGLTTALLTLIVVAGTGQVLALAFSLRHYRTDLSRVSTFQLEAA
ncbi:MAG TPA: MFS transporter [Candidatus Aquabacterium excrementipullorum]|nr:MFS transporter [Candidatus Aquabacterium excrementipullorum]